MVSQSILSDSADTASIATADVGQKSSLNITFDVSIFVYTIAICSFAGWILLIIFGGVGLFSLPFDFIRNFLERPKLRSSA